MNYVVGVDIGGTFTDCVVVDEAGQITIGKALSSPDDFSHGALNSVTNAARVVPTPFWSSAIRTRMETFAERSMPTYSEALFGAGALRIMTLNVGDPHETWA